MLTLKGEKGYAQIDVRARRIRTPANLHLLPSRLYCRLRICTGSCLYGSRAERRLPHHRRSGISPCPEDESYVFYMRFYISIQFSYRFCLHKRNRMFRMLLSLSACLLTAIIFIRKFLFSRHFAKIVRLPFWI